MKVEEGNSRPLGVKLDEGKLRVMTLFMEAFPKAIEEVTRVSEYGVKGKKYAANGWKFTPYGYERYSNAMMRHILAQTQGETCDPGSGLSHVAHAAWNALARLELFIELEKQVSAAMKAHDAAKAMDPYDIGKFWRESI